MFTHRYTNETVHLTPGLKGFETLLSVLSLVIVALTYSVLIYHAGFLVSTSKLPFKPLGENVQTILEATWPNESQCTENLPVEETSGSLAIRLVYVGYLRQEAPGCRVAKGINECSATVETPTHSSRMWLTSGSEATKAIVQLAIWEWISGFLMTLTVVTTVIFNGFTTRELSYDSKPRLVIISVYAFWYFVHTIFVWFSCQNYFTQVSAGAAWSVLNRARFAVVDRQLLFDHIHDSTNVEPLDFMEIEKISAGSDFVPLTYAARLPGKACPPSILRSPDEVSDLDNALKAMKNDQEKARSSFHNAAESALERVIANAVAMLGICITTGFATWTVKPLPDNSSSQIGSLALLASALVGVSAMFSSALHLSIMNKSFRQILVIKELKINGRAVEHFKNLQTKGAVGFTQPSLKTRKVNVFDILQANDWRWRILAIVFGPTYGLLPSKADNSRRSGDASFEHHISVRNRHVVLTTGRTDRHSRIQSDGENLEAINVYCQIQDLN